MRILLAGDRPGAPSAYGQQLGMVAELMVEAGYEVVIYAPSHMDAPFLWRSAKDKPAITVVGARETNITTYFGSDMLDAHAVNQKCDMIITFKDPYVFGPQLAELSVPWIPLVPVDTLNMSPANMERLPHAFRCISPSRHGTDLLQQAGYDATYIPHGIDLDVFKPGSKLEARKARGLEAEPFIGLFIGDNRTNPSRKNIENMLSAWSLFRQKHPESLLMLHTDLSSDRGGVDINAFLEMLNIPIEAVLMSDPYVYANKQYKPPYLASLYHLANVLIAPSLGEGFGLPILEAQACGLPVITTAVTAMTELTAYGVVIQTGPGNGDPFMNLFNAHQFRASAMSIARALDVIYDGKLNQADRRKGLALAKRYEYRRVFREHWVPFLKEIESFVMEGK